MSNYKLEFTLKQHTPIIHFQHDQSGATLRATEVKPKLDKFIINKLELTETVNNKKVPKKKYKHWFINEGKEHLALDYKIRIIANNKIKKLDNLITSDVIEVRNRRTGNFEEKMKYRNLPNFFGNMMKPEEFNSGEKKIKKITFYNEINLIITCFNDNLLFKVKENIPEFLLQTNFGTRQSKGFGSFYLSDDNVVNNNYFFFEFTDLRDADFYNLFGRIELFYKTLKSGLNIKTRNSNGDIVDKLYFKSLMFHYAKNLNPQEQWDKRSIRHSLYINDWNYKNDNKNAGVFYHRNDPEGTVHFNISKPENRNYYDFRDLLGLSTEQEWRYYRDKKITKKVSKFINNNRYNIERFKSPITFKPIFNNGVWRVYIILNAIPDVYLGSEVMVSNGKKDINLTIYPDFDINSYIEYAIDKFDSNDITYDTGFDENNVDEANILKGIYNSLKKQLKNNK